jgi:hypothetical protein
LIPQAAPSALARSSFSSLDEVMIATMPVACANCRPKIETPAGALQQHGLSRD